jgi:hypothetical protein
VWKIDYFWFSLPFDAFSIAILYLETQMKVHRDISYTNILLRDPGDDSGARRALHEKFVQQLGLTEINEQRKRLNCREGLLIDYDYGATLTREQTASDEEGRDGGEKQGEESQDHDDSGGPKPSGARTVS